MTQIYSLFDFASQNWAFLCLLFVALIPALYHANACFRTVQDCRNEAEQQSFFIDWYKVGKTAHWPKIIDDQAVTMQGMSLYAVAAYEKHGQLRMGIQSGFLRNTAQRRLYEFKFRNAFGIVCVDDINSEMIIAIAGTDQAEDAADDANVLRNKLGNWDKTKGFRATMLDQSKPAISSLGFTNYAELVMRGLAKCFNEHEIDPNEYSKTWITGHSLGGAAAWLIGQFHTFANATIITFGAARPLFISSVKPSRETPVLRVCGIFDPVQFAPPHYKHPRSDQLLVLGRRGKWPTIPWAYRPVFALIALMYWTIGLGCDIARGLTGWKWLKFSIATGHSMEAMYWNLNSHE